MGTFWTSEDLGDQTDAFGRNDVDDLKWDLQTTSRIGAKVKGDMVSGRFEYGTSGGNADIRLLYGVWQFTENWGLKVGQDYTPVYFGLSAQAFDNDANLWQTGNAYGGRRGQVALEGLGFKFAAIAPSTSTLDAGIGYLASESDTDQGVKFENTYLEYYLQATFTMFPGVYLVPEVGLRDYGDLEETGAADAGLGDLWYAGLKWQIDF